MQIELKLPIKITPTFDDNGTENDGYVITDSNETEFFFYKQKDSEELIYDGFCKKVK